MEIDFSWHWYDEREPEDVSINGNFLNMMTVIDGEKDEEGNFSFRKRWRYLRPGENSENNPNYVY